MIVKVAPNRRDGRSSFEDLGDYITDGIEQSGDRPERTSWDDLTQYITKQSVLDAMGDRVEKTIAVEAGNVHSLAHAAKEMRATAERCHRARNPVLHYILSWPEGERPEPHSIFRAARHSLRALGLEDHQYIIAIHDNTENRHAHIEVNRVHPITFKAAHLAWLHKTLHKAAREAEIEHGWSHDRGLFEVVEIDGRKVIVESRDQADPARAATYGGNRAEAWSGQQSLETWCRAAPAQALREVLADPKASTWQDVHAALARFGLELRDSGGGGMRVHDVVGDPTGMAENERRLGAASASKAFRFLKRSEVEARFGAFEPADPARHPAPLPETAYKRDPAKRLERRLARAASRDALFERFQDEQREARTQRALAEAAMRSEFSAYDKARIESQRSAYRASREAIRKSSGLSSQAKQQAYMLAKLTFEQQREQLREQVQQERAARRSLLAPLLTWREWVEAQAAHGDAAAISALRGLVYQDKRVANKARVTEGEDEDAVCTLAPAAAHTATDPYVRAVRRLSWRVSSHGNVIYRIGAGPVAFIDAGAKLHFGGPAVSEDALRVALRYASDKWQGQIRLNGGDELFRERVARIAAEMRIELRNPDLGPIQRRHLIAQGVAAPLPYSHPVSETRQAHLLATKLLSLTTSRRDLPSGNQINSRGAFDRHFNKPGIGFPAHTHRNRAGAAAPTIDGLRDLSSIPVVRFAPPPQVLLQDHAHHQLELGGAGAADALRRTGDDGLGLRLSAARAARTRGTHRGEILGQDAEFVYQKTRSGLVRHARAEELRWPERGALVVVRYVGGRPVAVEPITSRGRVR